MIKFRVLTIRFFLVVLLSFSIIANMNAQGLISKKVTINAKSVPAETVLNDLRKQTGINIVYSSELAKTWNSISVSATNKTAREVLEQVVGLIGCQYEMKGDVVTITRLQLSGKKRIVKGTVLDAEGEPLIGVPVSIGQTRVSTMTDVNGGFSLEIPTEKTTIKFSYVGMDDQYVVIPFGTSDVTKNITMTNGAELENVVVIGYYQQTKNSFTGAASSHNAEELKSVSNRDVLSALSVLDPSFKMIENISLGSDPNHIPDIQVRGMNALPDADGTTSNLSAEYKGSTNLPTFILDGFEVSVEKIYDLDPNRIANVSILKDASATAIYGSRAANGVVIVETITPKPGRLQVNYTGSIDFELADISQYNLLNASEKLEYERLAGLYNASNYVYVQEKYLVDYNDRLKLVKSGIDTDWLSKPLKSLGVGHKHTLMFEGGTDSFRYGVSFNYALTDGVMKGSGRKKLGTSFKFLYNYKNLRFKNEISFDNVKAENSPYGAFSTYALMNPYYNPYDDSGRIKQYAFESSNTSSSQRAIANPLYNTTLGVINENFYDDFADKFSIEWNITQRLKFKGSFSIERITRRDDLFKPADHSDFIGQSENKGSYSRNNTKSLSYDGSAVLSYYWNKGDHSLSINGGWNIQEKSSDIDGYTIYGFPNQGLNHPAFGTTFTESGRINGDALTSRLVGFLGNINYSWTDRYFIDASARIDGSSQFGKNQRWGSFWSTGIGWNVHNELFLKKQNAINQLRFRISTGYTGGQNFYPFQAMTMYEYNSSKDYQQYIGTVLKAYGNTDLKWQRTRKDNLGVDFAFLNNRISGYYNYFIETSDDLLVDINMASYLGFDTYKENLGETENKGWEFMLRVIPLQKKEWKLCLFFNGQHYTNTLKKISSGLSSYNEKADNSAGSAPYVRYIEGASINTIWVVPSLGIDPTTGKEVFVNKNNEVTDVWSEKDYVPYATSDPNLAGTFGINLYYKNWELNSYFYYRFGGYAYNQTLVDKVENVNPYGNVDHRALYDRWSIPGVAAKYKAINDLSITKPTSRFVEKDNLLTGSSVNISYKIDKKWIKNIGAEYMKFTFYANDFLYLSSIHREIGTSYPYAKHYSLTAQITF